MSFLKLSYATPLDDVELTLDAPSLPLPIPVTVLSSILPSNPSFPHNSICGQEYEGVVSSELGDNLGSLASGLSLSIPDCCHR